MIAATFPKRHITNAFYATYNNSVVRAVFDPLLETANTLAQKRYIDVWYNEEGQARGFMIFHKNNGVMDCTTTFEAKNAFLFLDCDALIALLDFASTAFAADYHAIKFTLPEEIHIDALLGDDGGTERTLSYNGMMRVVNVQYALQLCRCKGTGDVCIAIKDDFAPWNTGTWKLIFAPHQENIVCKTQELPDISMRINDFSALICGTCSTDDFAYMPAIQIHHADAVFSQVFYRKSNFVLNLF